VHLWVQLNLSLQVHLWVQLDLGLQVHLQTRSFTASKCITELLDLGLKMHLQTCSIMASSCISEFNLIMASKCISKLPPLRPPSTFSSSHDHSLQVHLWVLSISVSRCSCNYAPVPSAAGLAVCIYIEIPR
jgi:hypothetical protein